MSLASGASVASSIKEYAFRGLQQLPLVLTAMSLLFTVTTASISYLNLLLGFVLIIPLYTTLAGSLSEFALGRFLPGERFSWTRSSGDACRMVPPEGVGSLSLYESKTTSGTVVPSYWLMNITFFVGFVMSNLIDTFTAEPAAGTDPAAVERRMLHATYVAVAFGLFVLGIAIATCLAVKVAGGSELASRSCSPRAQVPSATACTLCHASVVRGLQIYWVSCPSSCLPLPWDARQSYVHRPMNNYTPTNLNNRSRCL
jgi:hypothetical protein